jgi:hypothetical protein
MLVSRLLKVCAALVAAGLLAAATATAASAASPMDGGGAGRSVGPSQILPTLPFSLGFDLSTLGVSSA